MTGSPGLRFRRTSWHNNGMLQQVGRILAMVGVLLTVGGGVLYLLGRLGVGRLPGDVTFSGKNWRVHVPLGTSILLSILLTLLMLLISRWRR